MLTIMTFCVISRYELYPFAPYTMYSYPFTPAAFHEIRIFFTKNDVEIELTPALGNIILPFDEARLKDSFERERWSSDGGRLESPGVRKKARELLKLVLKNTGTEYDSVRIAVFSFKDIADLRAGKITMIDWLDEKAH